MKKYRFILKIGLIEKTVVEYELASLEEATLRAESFLAPESDTFIDSVSFFEVREGFIYQVVYRLEKWNEPSENYGL